MSFQPTIPLSGVGGWQLLQRTEETQRALFGKKADLAADIAYFTENIAAADTPEKLVEDPRLLRIALGAFGLEEEAYKKALVRRVLEDGSCSSGVRLTVNTTTFSSGSGSDSGGRKDNITNLPYPEPGDWYLTLAVRCYLQQQYGRYGAFTTGSDRLHWRCRTPAALLCIVKCSEGRLWRHRC